MREEFPQFGQFKAFEVLVWIRLNKLQSLCNHNSSAAFPALKHLSLEELEIFERWVATEGEELTFSLLQSVRLKNCPKLTSLPQAPKLKLIVVDEDKAQLSLSVFESRHMYCLSDLWLSASDTEATPALELDQEPEVSLSVLHLHGCSFLFRSSPLQPTVGVWKWFGQLGRLWIESCDTLIYWPEEELRSLVSLEIFTIKSCSNLVGPTKVKGYQARGKGQLLPNLKHLMILGCGMLTELFVLPLSLTSIEIRWCHILESILGQDDRELESVQHFDTAAPSEHCSDLASTSLPEQSPSPKISHLPCLQYLLINDCKKLRLVSAQLDGLLTLCIWRCDELQSLDCLGDLPLLERLDLARCEHLVSVPGILGNYSALRELIIRYCLAMNVKPLHQCLQRRLDSLEHKDISHAGSRDPDEGSFSWRYLDIGFYVQGLNYGNQNPGNIWFLHCASASLNRDTDTMVAPAHANDQHNW